MTYQTIKTAAFEEDLDEALSYLVSVLHTPKAATNLIKEIQHASTTLETMPFIRAVSRRAPLRYHEYREYPVAGYVIVYRVQGKTVYFLRLFHQSQHYERFVMSWNSEN